MLNAKERRFLKAYRKQALHTFKDILHYVRLVRKLTIR